MLRSLKYLVGATSFMLSMPASAATVIANTGTPDGSTFGQTLDSTQSLAARFYTEAATLTEIYGFIGGTGGTFHIALYSADGWFPDKELYSTSAYATVLDAWQGAYGLNWAVPAGDYFVAFAVRPGDTVSGFMDGGVPHPLDRPAFNDGGNSPYYAGGSPIGVTIFDDFASAMPSVPEPATWEMMIIGFGAMGIAMRSRRKVAISVP